MSQCVPSWDLDENYTTSQLQLQPQPQPAVNLKDASKSSPLPRVPSLDYEVAELTWENGQLAMHGLGPPRVPHAKFPLWEKPRAGGTLESIVNQATRGRDVEKDPRKEMTASQWSDGGNSVSPSTSTAASLAITIDALVPCSKASRRKSKPEASVPCTRVGSCSGPAPAAFGGRVRVARAGISSESESATCGGESYGRGLTLDTCERELGGGGLTSTSLFSPDNTFSGKEYTKTSVDEHDSVCHGGSIASQKETRDATTKNKGIGKSSVSTKRSRAAAIHNQSERKRRDRINERMNTLQKLVPNSSKTDKASMLDEVIEYLKQLQSQIHMISRMNMSSMMMPLAMQQQPQMSMMNPLAVAMGMGMSIMDMNALGRAAAAAAMPPAIPPPAIHPSAAFIPVPSWDNTGSLMPDPLSAFLACQSQPMTMEAYNRLAGLYQHFQQQQQQPGGFGSSSKI